MVGMAKAEPKYIEPSERFKEAWNMLLKAEEAVIEARWTLTKAYGGNISAAGRLTNSVVGMLQVAQELVYREVTGQLEQEKEQERNSKDSGR